MATRKKTKTTRPAPRRAVKTSTKTTKKAAPAKAKKTAGKSSAKTPPPHEAPHTQQQAHAHTHHAQGNHTPDYSQLFAQMGAPFLAMMQNAASTQSADTQRMTQSWLDTQRQQWQSMLGGGMPYGGAGFSAASGPGSAFADMMRGGNGFTRAFDPFDQLASLPGLGYMREKHEEFARLYKAWQAHEAAQQKYNAEMARVMLEALARFEASIAAPAAGQKPFTSLKDVYTHWVNISEEVYARFAASPAHTALYGEVVNTLSAVKREMTVVIDQWAGQMNLPTRAEVDSLHQRMHDLKRELRALRTAMQDKKGRR